MSTVITNFEVHKPNNEVEQDKVSHWLAKTQSIATPDTFDERILQKFAVKEKKISKRSFFCNDFGEFDLDNLTLFKKENGFKPNLEERSKFYQNTVDGVFESFFEKEQDAPGEILHVTCTGYVSPSAGQKIIPKKEWSTKTGITHMYHMGCYAAMPAIKVASGMVDKKRIDIVHTELCSNHFDISAQTPEQTVIQTLFADGAIKYSLQHGEKPTSGIEVLSMKEQIVPDSGNAMTWGFGETHLEMTLHRTVPSLIKNNLETYTRELFASVGLDFDKDKEDTIFAIHPGGPKIIEQICDLLGLRQEQVQFSLDVLHERGNMSSATLPHVWKEIVESDKVKSGTNIFSVAFGPGLTVAGFMGVKV